MWSVTDTEELKKYDVVLTTYNILSTEYQGSSDDVVSLGEGKKQKDKDKDENKAKSQSQKKHKSSTTPQEIKQTSPIFNMMLYRLILDEAHVIRDVRTKQARTVFALEAERRIAVTGTPFQNKINDGFALLHFLRVEPLSDPRIWNAMILGPLRRHDPHV